MQWAASARLRSALLVGGALGLGAGLLAAASVDRVGPLAVPELSRLTTLPFPVFVVAVLGAGAAVLGRRHPYAGLVIFFAWLPLEDLIRKFAGNDLRIYFVKDALLFFALAALLPQMRGCWREPLGRLWKPTLLVFTVALVYSIPTALRGLSLPIVGLHQKFLFAALFPVGALLGRDRVRLERAILYLALLSATVCFIGILQVLIGPTFLNPQVSDPYLTHLTVVKAVGSQFVVRPSGPFADVSRFASMTIVAVLLGFCALRLSTTRARSRLSVLAILVSLAGAFASGSRTSLLICVPLALFGTLSTGAGGPNWRRGLGLVLAAAVTLALAGGAVAQTSKVTADFYEATLNPTSQSFEAGRRIQYYFLDALTGLEHGLIGHGTGDQSTGRRYVGVNETDQLTPESGWGSLALEWGLIGFAVWLLWSLAWVAKSIRLARDRSAGPAAAIRGLIAFYVFSLLIVQFSLGAGFFENYIANIFFWLLSGVTFALPVGVSAPTVPHSAKHRWLEPTGAFA